MNALKSDLNPATSSQDVREEVRRLAERVEGVLRVTNERIAALEALAGTVAPEIARSLMTVKAAAYRSEWSERGIRKGVRKNRLVYEWHGGRLFLA
jgi:hypothetical protein